MNKKLFEIVLYGLDEDDNVDDVKQPQWFVETSSDRAKSYALKDTFDSKDGLEWHAKVLRTENF